MAHDEAGVLRDSCATQEGIDHKVGIRFMIGSTRLEMLPCTWAVTGTNKTYHLVVERLHEASCDPPITADQSRRGIVTKILMKPGALFQTGTPWRTSSACQVEEIRDS